MWRLPIIPENILLKHFAVEKYNISHGRLHTLVTYAFSHRTTLSLSKYKIKQFLIRLS